MMIKDNKKYYITLTVATLLIILLSIVIGSFSDNSKVVGSCSINNIEYVNVSPSECWNDGINSDYCPLPGDISYSGELSGLGNLMFGLIGDL